MDFFENFDPKTAIFLRQWDSKANSDTVKFGFELWPHRQNRCLGPCQLAGYQLHMGGTARRRPQGLKDLRSVARDKGIGFFD